ncbi:MAG: O-antigen ligase family protein, partial [Candidatus Aminicenantes bacterium]|nr:O-antigen ligase family protein [Candidatus Aminicenantes bacterium]
PLLVLGGVGVYLLFSFISITIAQIFLAAALVGWLGFHISAKRTIRIPGFYRPLLVYVGLSLLVSLFSVNPGISFLKAREMLLFLIVPIVYTGFVSLKDLVTVNRVLLVSFAVTCVYTFYYYVFLSSPGERITGFMGHWMTQAGLLLLFCAWASALFLFKKRKIRYAWGGAFVLGLPLILLTLTRNSWVGLFAAGVVIVLLWKPKALLLVPVLAALFFLVSPGYIKDRVVSTFDLKNPTNKQRFEYWSAGFKIIRDFPLHGTGPDTVEMVFQQPKYGLSEIARSNVHLHNNILQIGAERGLFTLAAWLVFVIWLFVDLLRLLKRRDGPEFPSAAGALAALVGLFSAGLFEYNFGDAEVVVFFLYLTTVPFALKRLD